MPNFRRLRYAYMALYAYTHSRAKEYHGLVRTLGLPGAIYTKVPYLYKFLRDVNFADDQI